MLKSFHIAVSFILVSSIFVAGCTNGEKTGNADPMINTASSSKDVSVGKIKGNPPPKPSEGTTYRVKLETSRGDVWIDVHRDWSPNGADRFRELVEGGLYDDCRFFRVLTNFMAQCGINGDPKVSAEWRDKKIQDDPVMKSNLRGFVTFATGGKHTRTTQFFINTKSTGNVRLDRDGFSPFGEVVEGMKVVDAFYSRYGEGAPQGRGPNQGRVQNEGNKFLNAEFPKLDYIEKATIVDLSGDGAK